LKKEGKCPEAEAWSRSFRPDADLSLPEWADTHRILSSRGSAEAGRYRTDRVPFLAEIMDCLSVNNPIQKVVVMKAAQVGMTEACCNFIGCLIHNSPSPVLAVQPTIELAERFSRQKIEPMIEASPVLRALVAPKRAREASSTILTKEYPGGVLVVTGANSAVGLRSMAARALMLDEVDGYGADVGGEGDPIELAIARTTTFGFRRKILICSTPKHAGTSRIDREFQATDRRYYHVPCKHCGHMQTLRFANLRWEKGRPETAQYHCESCGAAMSEADKTAMLAAGEWRAAGKSEDPHTIGFHISALYSPVGWKSWTDIAREWEAAQKGGIDRLKSFVNLVLGEPWLEKGDAPDYQLLLERREPYQMGRVPRDALVLTAGADVQAQPARIELSVWAWGPNGAESWLIAHHVIDGHPIDRETWDEFAAIINQQWPCEAGGTMKIARIAVDTGGMHTQAVYSNLRRLRDVRIMPLKGIGGWNRSSPVNGPTMVDLTENGRKITRGLRLWTVAVDVLKSDVYSRLHKVRGEAAEFPPGYVHLPDAIAGEFVKQLCAEQLVTSKTRTGFSRMEWIQVRPNEALDCAVYARAALLVMGEARYGDLFWKRMAAAKEAAAKPSAPRPAPTSAPEPAPVRRAATPSPRPVPVQRSGPQIITAQQPAASRRFGLNRLAGA
jgi:phage terminase large subunit GpA-like protein